MQQQRDEMERSASLDSLVAEDKAARDSMDSVISWSSIWCLVEVGAGMIVRFWHDNQRKIAKDSIEL